MGRKRTGILAGALTLILLLAGGCGAQTETLRYALVTGQRGAKAEKALTQLESGMEDFAGAQGLKARTFASEKETVASYGDEISQAVQEGASVILANGEAMGKAVYTAQNEHRKTKFLLFGAEPSSEDGTKTKIRKNTLSILFSPEQEGYLAGYAAVKEGWQRIGFLAGPRTQDAERYYRGLVQGAEYAAGMLGLEEESVEIRFEFAGTGKLTPVRTEEALLWYEEGTEAILPYGEQIERAVLIAAEEAGGYVIGANRDLTGESSRVLFSVSPDYARAAKAALEFYEDGFRGGSAVYYGMKERAIRLNADFSDFDSFTQDDYNSVLNSVGTGTLTVSTDKEAVRDLKCVLLRESKPLGATEDATVSADLPVDTK